MQEEAIAKPQTGKVGTAVRTGCCRLRVERIKRVLSADWCTVAACFLPPRTMDAIAPYIDVSKTSLFLSLGAIAFNPTAWNVVARNGMECTSLARVPMLTTFGRVP